MDNAANESTDAPPIAPPSAPIGVLSVEAPGFIAPRHLRNIATGIIAVAALIWLLDFAETVIIPVLLGIIMSYSLRPFVEALKQYVSLPRPLSAAFLLITIFGGIALGLFHLRDDATAVISELPKAARMIREFIGVTREGAPSVLGDIRAAARELERASATLTIDVPLERKASVNATPPLQKTGQAASVLTNLQNALMEQLSSVVNVISTVSVAALLAFFLLCAGTDYRRKLLQIVGQSLARKKITLTILNNINTQIQYYLAATAVTNIGLGLATWALLASFGIERAFLWGIVAALLHLIPYLGTALFIGLCFVVGLVGLNSFWPAIYLTMAWLAIQFIIGFALNSYIQGRSARINSAALFVGFLVFGWLWGGWGLIVAAPVLAALKAVSSRVDALEDISTLMS